jgi:endonuclease/exonuclease/phosphatase family metal-dependent hydrolase
MSWNVEHFNIRHYKESPEVKGQMITLINQYQPDVVCFQEMVAGDSAPHRINYVGEFQQKMSMKYYSYSYRKELDFDDNHHFGIIIYSRYPIISQKSYEYQPLDYNSRFQYVDILKGRDTIRIFNVHLQTLRFTPDNIQYIDDPIQLGKDNIKESRSILSKFKHGFIRRHRQADRIKKIMDETRYPMVLCGDFNDVPNSYAYNTIGKNMQNAFVEAGYGIGATFSGILPILRIDNIFYNNRFEIKQYIRVPKKMSDHFPIITDLEIIK